MIGAVLLRYNGDQVALRAAVAAIVGDGPQPNPLVGDVVIVDNASTVDPKAAELVAASFPFVGSDGRPLVRWVPRKINDGFAAGNNEGIAHLRATCDLVLIHNDDATLAPGALQLLDSAIRSCAPDVVSVGPKTLIAGEDGLIDSVGMAVNRRGEAKNVGLGQLDLGQFDGGHVEGQQTKGRTLANGPYPEILGPCFAVALIRRSAFAPESVGPLPADYFLYYEDVEWNWKAHRLGLRSLLVPHTLAYHHMSSSSRAETTSLGDAERAYGMKHRCIERNLLVTGAELLPLRDAAALWLHRWPRLVKAGITGRFPKASVLAAFDAVRRLPRTLQRRRHVQRNSAVPANRVFSFWPEEPIFFDPVTYLPQRSWQALAAAAALANAPALVEACGHADPHGARQAAAAELGTERAELVSRYIARLP